MTTIGQTNNPGLLQFYNISLGLMISLPSLSVALNLLKEQSISETQKLYLGGSLLLSCGLVFYSKDNLLISLCISILTILHYKKISSNNDNSYFKIWTNTLVIMNIILGILYSVQLSLRKPSLNVNN
jgi:hypothetical protein